VSLELPNLDDRTYDDLVKEALSLIPTYAPEWTNHNPSDPGITLIELFAYFSEMMIYRLNRVTNANKQAFLNLINGPEWKAAHPDRLGETALNAEIRQAVLALRQSDRAVTSADFETLARENPQVARARCLPQRNLDLENPRLPPVMAPGHISVVIIPSPPPSVPPPPVSIPPQPSDLLIKAVKNYLDERRLLTTQVHVVGPRYLKIGVQITLMLKADALEADVRKRATIALQQFFDPLPEGTKRQGWEFGRNIYVSELYQLLDQLPGVDYVTNTVKNPITNQDQIRDEITLIPADPNRRQVDRQGNLSAIALRSDELVNASSDAMDIVILSPVKSWVPGNLGGA
jgi:Baseplate J-like protein